MNTHTLKGLLEMNLCEIAKLTESEAREYLENIRWPNGPVVHTNTTESFFSLIKRGHYGAYHQMSKKHLHRYCHEFAFRWTNRKVTDGARTEAAIQGSPGKRLMYKTSGKR